MISGGLLMVWAVPELGQRVDNYAYYARSQARRYYLTLFPPPQYLPTPALAQAPTPTPTASATLTATPTRAPTNIAVTETPTVVIPTPTPEPSPTATPFPVAEQVQLTGVTHQWQSWNNCGPATITMQMSYFGRTETQVEAARFLKPNRDDKNVGPNELVAYARSVGLEAIMRHGGTLTQVKRFLNQGLPVLAETWLVHEGDGLGHYRLLTGYDDATQQFTTFDSLNGPDYLVDYAQFDADWRVFNRLYVVVYTPAEADLVHTLIGTDMNDITVYERLLSEAQAESAHTPDDAIAHFNQGEMLTLLGRYEGAALAFDEARRLGLHWRRLWYQFTPFEAYLTVGRYQDVLDLAQATINGAGGLEEAYYYKGLALQALNQPGAAASFQLAVDYNPNFAPAAEALAALEN